jgi:carboxypeptidase Taq
MSTPYEQLHRLSTIAAYYTSIRSILEWDMETYMPKGAIGARSTQLELLAGWIHRTRTSPQFFRALSRLIDVASGEIMDDRLSAPQIAALKAWRRDYVQAASLPSSFVKKYVKTVSEAMHAWGEAKRHNTFATFLPHLERIVSLSRKKADYLGFQEHPYDALLDLFEPGMTTHLLAPLFSRLKLALNALLKAIEAQPQPPCDFLCLSYDPAVQLRFSKTLLHAMGVSEEISRLDQSLHPFCQNVHPRDTRLTTRIHPEFLPLAIRATLHEGGHALYHMHLPEEHFGSPLCESASLGIDESQSRWWEVLIGQSAPFWEHFYPILQDFFPDQLGGISREAFYRALNRVEPSLIRTEADELTYSLHIIVRFEIERALIEGSLRPKEVPEAWNEKMRHTLGVTPAAFSDGCLQDVHWAMGSIGYFPTYTLGNLYAAQFFEAFKKEHPHWHERVARGELPFIREWLARAICRHGRIWSPHELVMRTTGAPLSEDAFIRYLDAKYRALYDLS